MLRLENVSKRFDGFYLDNISFELKEGFIMGLIGPNGSGKTTLIKIIMNLLNQDEGNIYFMGENVKNNPMRFKENIGFVYDNLYFYENFDNKKFKEYLDKFQISKKTKIKNLSKGQSIKLMLAKALSHSAKLLILDEPTSGLDPIFRKDMIKLIQEELESGDKSAIFSTHITQDLEHMADYITFINKGKLVFSESKEFIDENYKIIRGSKEMLDNTNIDFIKRKDERYFSEGIFIESGYKNSDNISKATLEEILYYMGGETIND